MALSRECAAPTANRQGPSDLAREERVHRPVVAALLALAPALRAEDSLERIAGLLGDLAGGLVSGVRPELEPRDARSLESPAGNQHECPRRHAASTGRRPDPVADLADVALEAQAQVHGPEDAAVQRVGDGERGAASLAPSAAAAAQVGS